MHTENIKDIIEKNNISWIQLHFNDIFGRLKVLHVPAERFIKDDIINKGFTFDGSSVGYTDVDKSDMICIPDTSSFLILPQEKDEARIISELYNAEMQRSNLDSRYALKNALDKAKMEGFDEVKISPEMEFFLMHNEKQEFNESNYNGYFSSPPDDDGKEYRKIVSEYLIKSGYDVKYHHHENGRYQHEIEIKNLDAIHAADFCIYFKYLSREIARRNNLKITFMPKVISNEAGNGMHAHLLLNQIGKNLFYDENDEYNLSQIARYFIGGILKHSKAITAIANPTVNSYKRLISNFEAPMFIAWAKHNRTSLIRIAAAQNIDIEIRNADPLANPYLFYTALIYSGLDGIKNKIEYNPIEKNIYKMSNYELNESGVERLPKSLIDALYQLENDDFLTNSIGKELIDLYIQKKQKEWDNYMTEVSDTDYEYYMDY